MKHVAVYARVSSNGQDTKSQEPDLKRWADAQDAPMRWYRDKATGTHMERPGGRKVSVVWIGDGLDLSTAAGRLMANVLASVAQYETEVRGERVAAGQSK